MNIYVEKSGSGIHRSGTGIHRSGTGIHRSGTGIHKSGTGVKKGGTGARVPSFLTALLLATVAFCGQAFAADPEIMVSERADNLMISLHSDAGIFIGTAPLSSGDAGYFRIGLHQVAVTTDEGIVARSLVKASGSGAAGESIDGSGASLLVKASGSGSSGDSTCTNSGLLVKSSGSGASGESIDGSGGSLLVKASGSGSSGDDSGECSSHAAFDLLAELVIDHSGSHVVVHDRQGNELLVAFVAAASLNAPDRRVPNAARGFVATP